MKKTSIDYTIFGIALLLTIFGVIMVYNSSSASALRDFGDKFFFVKDQIKWAIIGVVSALVISKFDYHRIFRFSPYILLGVIVLLVAVFVPGLGIRAYGASRWINLHFFVLQPSEIAKLAFVIYLSAWFSTKDKSRLFSFLVLTGTITGLVLLQPDMGTAMIFCFTALAMFYLSDGKILHVLSLGLGILPLGLFLAIKSPYRMKRLTSFLDPESDPLGASYHIRQAIIALGSGGLVGLGLGNSRQKYSYLPEANTDSIFAIIGEELGLIGVAILMSIFLGLIFKCMKLARDLDDDFGQMLVAGITSWLTIQTIVNLGSIMALMPLTGVPLPFISYGGSALVAQWIGIGIILSVSRHRKQ